jgi:replication factor C small subunit
MNLWTERYRPTTASEYVFKDDNQRQIVAGWIAEKNIGHLLLSGPAGTGKTSLAKVLVHDLEIADEDFMYINASRDNGIEMIRRKITAFSETMPWASKFKIILLDEADNLTADGMLALRGVIEQYESVVRFILTCNYAHRIIPAIHSRCQSLHIASLDQSDFTVKIVEILADNEIEFDIDTVDAYVKGQYPDLRKTINSVQQNIKNGKLINPSELTSTTDWKLQMVVMFKDGKLKQARELICRNAIAEDYDEIYRFLYRNLEFFGDTEDKQDAAVIIIRDSMVKHTLVADVEINLSACLIELGQIA